jgi:hypothetical protein
MRTGLLLVLFVGCGGSPSKPAADPTPPVTASLVDCDKVAEHVATTAQTAKLRSGASYEAIKSMVSTRCTTDAWSDETKQCLFAIKTVREGRDCATKMTDAQRTAIHTDAQALRKEAAGPVEGEDHSGDWIEHVVEVPATTPATKS